MELERIVLSYTPTDLVLGQRVRVEDGLEAIYFGHIQKIDPLQANSKEGPYCYCDLITVTVEQYVDISTPLEAPFSVMSVPEWACAPAPLEE